MAVAVKPDVANLDGMLSRTSDKGGTNEKAVPIVMDATAIVVVCSDSLYSVTLRQKILSEEVCNINTLPPEPEFIESAVSILFKLIKIGYVKLRFVIGKTAEKATAEVVVGIQKASEVGIERLDTGTERDEIIIIVRIEQLDLGKRILKRDLVIRSASRACIAPFLISEKMPSR